MTLYALQQKTVALYPNLDINDVNLALMHVYHINDYSTFVLKLHEGVKEKVLFKTIINRLLNAEPIQYILGSAYFYDRDFFVNKNVLIPRPETEELVDLFIKENKDKVGNVVDVGTGSGVIALTLSNHTSLNVYATDISKKALKVAKVNDTNNKVTFMHGHLLLPLIKSNIPVSFIVANLPYIKKDEKLDTKVKDYEPARALFYPSYNIYKTFFKQVKKLHISEEGLSIYLEVGTNQAAEVKITAQKEFGESVSINIVQDMQQKDRFVIIKGIYGHKNLSS